MKGALLVNLGSPNTPSKEDVKSYLSEFLMDKYVIDIPYLARIALVKGVILHTRPKKSSLKYKKIWLDEGSPLIVYSRKMYEKVCGMSSLPVALAMRYGEPSLYSGLNELYSKGVRLVKVIPLYPQHAMSTTLTVTERVKYLCNKYFPEMAIELQPAFYNRPEYLQAMADSIRKFTDGYFFDYLLFSYHGVPERHIRKTDITKSHCKIDGSCCTTKNSSAQQFCYRHQCYETTRLVAKLLGLKESQYSTSFQSRLGVANWLKPYTNETLQSLSTRGIKNLAVVTPSFVVDCLETLEEIGMEGQMSFVKHGGENFFQIPCLNHNDDWCGVLAHWINDWGRID